MNSSLFIRLACFTLTIGSVIAQQNAQQAAAPPRAARVGYLSPADSPDFSRIVPAAPTAGDSRDALDLSIFRATRSLEGSPRWALALSDNDVSTAGLFKAFSCSLGVELTRDNAPLVTALVTKLTADSGNALTRLKQLNQQRKRPFMVAEGPICLPSRASLDGNPDYPSGHSTSGWTVGLVLAEMAPDAASAILSRARAIGESRVVCGVHNASAIDAGFMTASAVVAALHGSAAFRADMGAARSELAAARAHVSGGAGCALEAEILATRPY